MEEKRFIEKIYSGSLWAVTLAVLLVQICSIVNTIVAGNLVGADGLSVMSLMSPVSFAFATVGSLLAVGGSILSARSIGERNYGRSTRYLTTVLLTILVIGGLFTVFGLLFPDALMGLLGVPEGLKDATRAYLLFYMPAAIGAMGIYVPFNFLKINGDQKFSVILFGVMALCNIGLDFLFAGALDMGIAGIGLASTVANWVGFVPGVLLLFSKRCGYRVRFAKKIWKDLIQIFTLGSPSATGNLSNLLRSYFLNRIVVAALPEGGLPTLSIISTIFSFGVVAYNGVSMSMAQFVAVFSAEQDVPGQKQIFKTAMKWGIFMTAVLSLFVAVFPTVVCGIFSVESAAMRNTAIRLFALSIIPALVNSVIITFHQSNNHALLANILTAMRGCVLVVLSAWCISSFAADWLWLGFLAAELLTFGLCVLLTELLRRREKGLTRILLIDELSVTEAETLNLSVGSENDEISACADAIRDFCEQHDLPPKTVMAIGLAVEELAVNFNEYALSGIRNPGKNHIKIVVYPDKVLMRFRTGGRLYDPLAVAEEDDDLMSLSMGVRLVKKLARSIAYNRVFGINNLVIII